MGWRTYLTLGRVSNLPTVWTNALAGTVLAGASPSPGTFLPLLASLSLFYVGGMFLNDAFDRTVDARERPERPIPAGAVSARRVFALGFGMLAGGLALLVPSAAPGALAPTLICGAALAGVIVAYDAWHKGNPLGPVVMGLARALVYVTAGAAAGGVVMGGGGMSSGLLGGALVLLAYLIGLTYAAKQETLGLVRNLWPLLFLAVPFVYGALWAVRMPPGVGTLLWLAFLAWVAYALVLLARPPRRIGWAVVSLIAGISLLDAMLIALHGAPGLAWLGVAGFAATLALQKVVSGT